MSVEHQQPDQLLNKIEEALDELESYVCAHAEGEAPALSSTVIRNQCLVGDARGALEEFREKMLTHTTQEST